MSVRLRRNGSNTRIQDHNDLLNKGQRTHSEIDSYLNEIDSARGTFPGLGERLDYVQAHAGGGSGGSGAEFGKYLYEVKVITSPAQRSITLSGEYKVGLNELEVFRNGQRQYKGVDYYEANSVTVTFISALEVNDIVVSRIRDRGLSPVGFRDYYFVAPEYSIFTVDDVVEVDGKNFEVYLNNQLLTFGVDYTVTADKAVKLEEVPPVGSLVCVKVLDKYANDPKRVLEELIEVTPDNDTYSLTEFTYRVGAGELEIYLNGNRLFLDKDYTEVDHSSFRLLEPIEGTLLASRENNLISATENYEVKDARYSTITGVHSSLQERIEAGEARADATKQAVESLTTDVSNLHLDVQNTQNSIDRVEGNVSSLASSTATKSELATLDNKVSVLENSLQQVTKLNKIASQVSPYVVDITISETLDFKTPPVNVLRFQEADDMIVTECNFDNSDATNFITDDQVVFDGKMHLNVPTVQFTDGGALGAGKLQTLQIDLSKYKNVESVVTS